MDHESVIFLTSQPEITADLGRSSETMFGFKD